MPRGHTLFSKRSQNGLHRKVVADEEHDSLHQHLRTMSTSSSVSRSSSTGSHTKATAYDPLALHPPLFLNTSPMISEYDEDTHDKVEHEDNHSEIQDSGYSSEESVYYNQDKRRRTYVYDQQLQWPLKDWQTVPPGLANMSEDDFNSHMAPCTTSNSSSQRRPSKEAMSESDMFVKRGDWKRRGIVFGLSSDAEDEQSQHFELPAL